MEYVLAFVVAIGVLVTVHEFGHFWVARRLGVKVLRFSVGFGKTLWSWRDSRGETEYVIAAVPLGGYVKMLDEREGEVGPEEVGRAFNRQTMRVRTAIVLAGPLFNFLFAIVAYWLMFVIGVSGPRPLVGDVAPGTVAQRAGLAHGQQIVSVDGRGTPTWEMAIQTIIGSALTHDVIAVTVQSESRQERQLSLDLGGVAIDDLTRGQFFSALGFEPLRPRIAPIIGHVEADGAAARSGLQEGDLIVSANGEGIGDWSAWVEYVRAHPDVLIDLLVDRNGVSTRLELRPAAIEEDGRTIGRIGAGVKRGEELLERFYVKVRHGPVDAAGRALVKTYDTSALTLRMFWKMVKLEVSLENLSGPISIAQYAGYTAKAGLSKFIEFLAIVSISLGILNLLPIPILDGGHLMYYFIELLKGGPVSEEAQFMGQRLGIAMLFGLMGLAFYNDLVRLFG